MAEHICTVDGCGWHQKIIRGYCNKHYQRWKKYGTAELPPRPAPPRLDCTVNGCDREREAHGYCHKHYERWRKYGDPLVVHPRPVMNGEDHPMWAGDKITYLGLHVRLKLFRGRASERLCVECGAQARDWSYNNTGVSERIGDNGRATSVRYSTDVTQYSPRCRPCHRAFDKRSA